MRSPQSYYAQVFSAILFCLKRNIMLLVREKRHSRRARGGYGLPKVSPRPAVPYPFMPYGWASPETALRPFEQWPVRRVGVLRPSSTPLDTLRHTPMESVMAYKS
jgi:hypothetical protein